ncbi:MAG TPA: UDP-N-acetylmuramoyl-L-alanine--D-glutamate ligase [Candidatus Acidoferrales bacterium]|nr:UDP-N-acetylmuramoyl-L-alanine--D-glutamate ligase [Candidatus Acidoferrales bacterium]
MQLKGKTVVVIGFARTGLEVARFLALRQARVIVTDRRPMPELQSEVASLAGLPVSLRLGEEAPDCLGGVDLVVPSPGVGADHPLLRQAWRRGIEIASEIELAARFMQFPLIAVTGTNGKSTTTSLIGAMLKESGLKSFVGGNIGVPLIHFADAPWDWGVVEVSSFQLEWTRRFRPRIAVLLNLSEDHLDRYASFTAYVAAKERLFQAQGPQDVAVLNRDDPWVWRARTRIRSRVISFGWSQAEAGVTATRDEIVWHDPSGVERFALAGVKIAGVHNIENLMAAIAVARTVGVQAPVIRRVMEEFSGLEHRLEFVSEKNGVRFYNDSKATNVGAVVKSLMSFSAPVILLAGGVDKHGDYGVLEREMRRVVKKLVLYGAAKQKIYERLGHLTQTAVVGGFEEAVREAAASAAPGDVVLLSPACSSFDMFQNYEERGRAFKELVRRL